jgi:hypothetical protein
MSSLKLTILERESFVSYNNDTVEYLAVHDVHYGILFAEAQDKALLMCQHTLNARETE